MTCCVFENYFSCELLYHNRERTEINYELD